MALRASDASIVIPQYGDPVFDADTLDAFESGDAYVADAEQARVLWDQAWTFLDTRCAQELEFFGALPNPPPGTVGGANEVVVVSGPDKVRHVELVRSTGYKYSSEEKRKVFMKQTLNGNFLEEVANYFPDKTKAKIVVVCSDGRQRSVKALEMLEEAGYEKLVLLRGGFTLYNRGWDGKLKRRLPHGQFTSNLLAPGDAQQFSRGDRNGNANDAIEFGPWQDENDWRPALES